MSKLLGRANVFVLLSYLVLSAIPFIPLMLGKPVSAPWRIAGMELFAWVTLWSLLKHPARFHWLLLPAFLALPIEIYLQIFYGQSISTHHLGVIAETSPKEAIEFLGNKAWLLLGVFSAVLSWWLACWFASFRTDTLTWHGKSRLLMPLLILVAALLWLYGHLFGIQMLPPTAASTGQVVAEAVDVDEDASGNEAASAVLISARMSPAASGLSPWPQLPAWAALSVDIQTLSQTWPFGLAIKSYEFWQERAYLGQLSEHSNRFKFGAHQPALAHTPEIVVMVIGESARYDRWSLNGYARKTNPLLEKEANLVSLENVVTAVSATRLSVPILVSRKPAMQSLKAGFTEKSFLSAYKEAGFKTYWLSNQMSFGEFDTPVSVFANEADVTQFLNLGGFTDNSSLDEILLEPLRNAIADPAPKKLIVLHTLGNHWNYSHRYPRQFDRWQPSLFGIDAPDFNDRAIKPQMNNSYDNSVLYTDWFLAQVIATLKATRHITSMMYVSDHGQTLYDGSCELAFHGHNTDYEFHVPALVWYSDLYQQAFPEKVAELKQHRRAKLATENVFHSLLDMADIRYSNEHLEWSFFSKKLKRHKRYVDSYGWTDYDNAVLKGDCKEVIDKGKPLVQEQ